MQTKAFPVVQYKESINIVCFLSGFRFKYRKFFSLIFDVIKKEKKNQKNSKPVK